MDKLERLEQQIKKLKRVVKTLAELVIEIGTLYAMIRFMIDR